MEFGNNLRGDKNLNPAGLSFWELVREDLRTHESLFAHGFWALFVHRFGNWRVGLPGWLRAALKPVFELLLQWCFWVVKIELPHPVKVGRRVRIWHNGNVVLGAIYIGDDVQIRHNVTLGLAQHGAPVTTLPIIEERVLIGVGAVVLGPITIGHDSIVAANAVVTQDVPPYSLVAGIPAKVIRKLDERELRTDVNIRETVIRRGVA
jgi:serine O-acetyltransferase